MTTVTNTTGVINKAALTITAVTSTKVYDTSSTTPTLPTVTGLQGLDSVSNLSEVFTDPNVGTGKTLSVNGYTVNDTNGGNDYTVTTVSTTTGVITQATLTITATTNNKAYDATNTAAATPTVSGLQGGDSVSGLTEVYASKNAGTGKTLSVSGYTVSDNNNGANYNVVTVDNTTGIVTKVGLTISATTNTKTYDSSVSAAATPTVTGLKGSDTVTGLTEVYSNPNAGTGKSLSIGTYVVNDGNTGGNYNISLINNLTGAINKAALTITARTNTKNFDGTNTAFATPTVSGLVGADTVTGLAEVYANVGPGTSIPLSVSAYTVNDGNTGGNYTVATVNDNTGAITSGGIATTTAVTTSQASIVYGSTVTFTITVTAQTTSAPTGNVEVFDNGSHDLGAATFGSSAGLVSTYTLTTLSKTFNVTSPLAHVITANYAGTTTFSGSSGTLSGGQTVTPKAITITAASNTKTYDSTTTAGATPVVSGGLVGTDTVTGLSETYTTATAGAGKTETVTNSYTVNDSNAGKNYTVTTVDDTTGVINKAALTITASTNTKTYDSTTTAAATPTVAGLVGGDTVSSLSESYATSTAGTGKTLNVNAGFVVNDGNAGGNYTVTTAANTTGVINKAALTITASTNTKTYDSTTTAAATPTVAGLVGGDTVSSLSESYATSTAGTGKTLNVNAGFVVNDGNTGGNYTVTTAANTTGVINKAALTITASTNTKTYDSTTTAAATPTVAGLVGGDTVTGLSESYATSSAGSSKTLSVNAGYVVNDGNTGGNYTVTTAANTTGVINKAALTITASTNTKNFDGTNTAAATPTVSGLKGGDTVTGLAEVYANAGPGSNIPLSVTTYTVNDGNTGNNYTVSTVIDNTGLINGVSNGDNFDIGEHLAGVDCIRYDRHVYGDGDGPEWDNRADGKRGSLRQQQPRFGCGGIVKLQRPGIDLHVDDGTEDLQCHNPAGSRHYRQLHGNRHV